MSSDCLFVVGAAVLGLLFGSFGTVAAWRIPRNQNIASGRSHCPNCDHTITWWENIPVFSWLILRGKCHECKNPISIRYPLIELTTGVLFALAAAKFDLTVAAFVYMAFFWTLVVLTVIDLDFNILPNRIVYPAFIAGWAGLAIDALVEGRVGQLGDAAIGAAIFGGFFFLIASIVPAGMGGGDVKLAFVLGTFLGYVGAPGVVLTGMFLSFLLGGVVGIAVMLATGGNRKMKIPFGPFLAGGTVLAVFIGQEIVDFYLDKL